MPTFTRRYEAIFFDFDGVLVDSEPVHWRCWNEILSADYGYTVSWEDFAANCVGVHERGTVEWLRQQRTPEVAFDDLWSQYARKKQLCRDLMLLSGGIRPEVSEFVKQLHPDFLLAVVTSSAQAEVSPVLENAGLLPLLTAAVYGGDVANLKPAPDPYLLACQRAGTANALVVEDSHAGMTAARAAGLEVLQIRVQAHLVETVKTHLVVGS
ncbi:MAG: HAD family phosphatase [Bryobacteraceae bacterium]|nr:HAD family phosphatase [Bryobacteraceae bacterium]